MTKQTMSIALLALGSVAIAILATTAHADTYEPGETFKDCDGCPAMVVVPAGTFIMGSPEDEEGRRDVEGPQYKVTISKNFAVGKFEVTFDEWDACVADLGCFTTPDDESWGRGTRPVINVSWEGAKIYTDWLSQETGFEYRLMSEAEWEYAARAGTTTPFPWGQSADHDFANYGEDECCTGLASGKDQWVNTSPAGSFSANAFGLHDMHGNAYELVEDCWNRDNSEAPSDGSARLSGDCDYRILRGGSWVGDPNTLRSAYRNGYNGDIRFSSLGFRVARTLD